METKSVQKDKNFFQKLLAHPGFRSFAAALAVFGALTTFAPELTGEAPGDALWRLMKRPLRRKEALFLARSAGPYSASQP